MPSITKKDFILETLQKELEKAKNNTIKYQTEPNSIYLYNYSNGRMTAFQETIKLIKEIL